MILRTRYDDEALSFSLHLYLSLSLFLSVVCCCVGLLYSFLYINTSALPLFLSFCTPTSPFALVTKTPHTLASAAVCRVYCFGNDDDLALALSLSLSLHAACVLCVTVCLVSPPSFSLSRYLSLPRAVHCSSCIPYTHTIFASLKNDSRLPILTGESTPQPQVMACQRGMTSSRIKLDKPCRGCYRVCSLYKRRITPNTKKPLTLPRHRRL